MLPMFSLLRSSLQSTPYFVGHIFSYLPFWLRPYIGPRYLTISDVLFNSQVSSDSRDAYVHSQLLRTIRSASMIPFYRDFYGDQLLDLADNFSWASFSALPLTNKSLLRKVDLSARTNRSHGIYRVNTGGTSGSPLSFCISPDLMAYEWAHMHSIWRSLGYKTRDLKLVFSGLFESQYPNLL